MASDIVGPRRVDHAPPQPADPHGGRDVSRAATGRSTPARGAARRAGQAHPAQPVDGAAAGGQPWPSVRRRLPFPLLAADDARRRRAAARRDHARRRLRHRVGPLATRPAWPGVLLLEGVVRPAMRAAGLADRPRPRPPGRPRGPGRSSRPTTTATSTRPLLLSAIPEPWRHHMVIGAAADYFFGNRVTAPLSALVIGAIPIERTKVGRKSADDAAALHRRRLEHADLPRGRTQPRRLGPAVPRRRRLPVAALRRAGRARSTSRAPGASCARAARCPSPSSTTITFGAPMRPTRTRTPAGSAARIEASRRRAGRRGAPPTGGRPASGPTHGQTPTPAGTRDSGPGAAPGPSATAAPSAAAPRAPGP